MTKVMNQCSKSFFCALIMAPAMAEMPVRVFAKNARKGMKCGGHVTGVLVSFVILIMTIE